MSTSSLKVSALLFLTELTDYRASEAGKECQWKMRENKKASRPAYDLLIKDASRKRGRVFYTFFLDV